MKRRTGSLATRHGLLAAVSVAATLFGALPRGAAARDFRVADTQGERYPTVQALFYMAKLVAGRTGGRHHLIVFHSRQLGEEKETVEQTRAGAIDLNRVSVAPLASFAPEASVLALPFLFASTDHLHRVLDGQIGADILAKFEAHGFVGLTFYDAGARSIYNSVRPVRSLADLAGLRIRVQQSELSVATIGALGAEPVELPYGQVGTALSTGLVDGAENNWPSYVTTEHFRLARFITLTEHTMTPDVLLMSRKAWDELTPEDQTVFRDAARESSGIERQQWRQWEDDARRAARDNGNEIIETIDKRPFIAALAGVFGRTLAAEGMEALVQRIRAAE